MNVEVPVVNDGERRNYRLIELTPALADALENDVYPLTLKSSDANAADKAAFAVLCTPVDTYQVRQVQTSNSLLLAEARHPTRNGDNTNEVLAIVGSCDAVLHIEYDKTAAISFLGSSLPVFADIELFSGVDDANPACSTSGGAARDKSGVFQNCPFSDGQCQSAWSDLMAFEHNGTAFGPSPILCLQVWQAMIDACYAGDISIQHPISMAQVRAHIEPDGIPADLIYAIVGQVSCDKPGNVASTSFTLDRAKCLDWICNLKRETPTSSNQPLSADVILRQTYDYIPECWRDVKTMNELTDIMKKAALQHGTPNLNTKTNDSSTKKTRRWHDMLM